MRKTLNFVANLFNYFLLFFIVFPLVQPTFNMNTFRIDDRCFFIHLRMISICFCCMSKLLLCQQVWFKGALSQLLYSFLIILFFQNLLICFLFVNVPHCLGYKILTLAYCSSEILSIFAGV